MIKKQIKAVCYVESLPDPNGDMVTNDLNSNTNHLLAWEFQMVVFGIDVEAGCFESQNAFLPGS